MSRLFYFSFFIKYRDEVNPVVNVQVVKENHPVCSLIHIFTNLFLILNIFCSFFSFFLFVHFFFRWSFSTDEYYYPDPYFENLFPVSPDDGFFSSNILRRIRVGQFDFARPLVLFFRRSFLVGSWRKSCATYYRIRITFAVCARKTGDSQLLLIFYSKLRDELRY